MYVLLEHADCRINLSNNIIADNTAFRGGGLFAYGALTINNNTVTGNTATYGGGVGTTGIPIITNSIFYFNDPDSLYGNAP